MKNIIIREIIKRKLAKKANGWCGPGTCVG